MTAKHGTLILPHGTIDTDCDPQDVSDGYHTFKELYHFRAIYNAAFFNEVWRQSQVLGGGRSDFNVHKSWRHYDGELCFGGGWFIVMAQLPTGQISNHYPAEYWSMFNVPEAKRAAEWDGHNADDAAQRIVTWLESQ